MKYLLIAVPAVVLYALFALVGCFTNYSFDYIYLSNWQRPIRFTYAFFTLIFTVISYMAIYQEVENNG